MSEPISGRLDKTSAHAFQEIDTLLQDASDKASLARSVGSGRSKGFASLIGITVGVLVQSGSFFAIGKLGEVPAEPTPIVEQRILSESDREIVLSNLERIRTNADAILETKKRVAPSVPVEPNIVAIRSAAQDLQTVILKDRPQAPTGSVAGAP